MFNFIDYFRCDKEENFHKMGLLCHSILKKHKKMLLDSWKSFTGEIGFQGLDYIEELIKNRSVKKRRYFCLFYKVNISFMIFT